MSEIPYAYRGEVQLLRWSETPKGRTVTLLLDPFVGEQHPFKAMKCGENGSRMQIAAVLVGDDDQPAVPPTKPKVAEKKTVEAEVKKERTPFDKIDRSQQAALRIRDEEFQAWLFHTHRDTWLDKAAKDDPKDADTADAVLKAILRIGSKCELDFPDSRAADMWDRLMTDYSVRGMVR